MKGDSWVSFWMISHQELAKFAADVVLVNYMYLGVSYREMTYLPVGLDGQLERGRTDRITVSRSRGLESLKCGTPKNCQSCRGNRLVYSLPRMQSPESLHSIKVSSWLVAREHVCTHYKKTAASFPASALRKQGHSGWPWLDTHRRDMLGTVAHRSEVTTSPYYWIAK